MPQVRRGQIGTNQAVVERERRVELISGGGKERKGKSWVLVLVRASHDAACARTRSAVTSMPKTKETRAERAREEDCHPDVLSDDDYMGLAQDA